MQPHAGAQTNMAVYFACLQPGDTILSLELSHGGHLTHGLKVNFSGRLYQVVHYGVSRETNVVDYDDVLALAREHRRKADRLRRLGLSENRGGQSASARSRTTSGHCCSATWRTSRASSPRGSTRARCRTATSSPRRHTRRSPGLGRDSFFAGRSTPELIDRAVFPGMQGGPLNHVIAAKAACFLIASSEPFRRYQESVRANADVLAETLQEEDSTC